MILFIHLCIMVPPVKLFGEVTRINSEELFEKGTTNDELYLVIAEAEARIQENDAIADQLETEEYLKQHFELEDVNFRVENTENRKETIDGGVRAKVNPEGDVWEYLEGDNKGEQLFTGPKVDQEGHILEEGSAIRETKKMGKKLPKSWKVFESIIENNYKGNYQDFISGEKITFPGWFNGSGYETFNDIDYAFILWCADGTSFYGTKEFKIKDDKPRECGLSVRCMKE